jgi:ketosteroid isomerase-like protein
MHRSLDESLFVCWPLTYAVLARLTVLLPPRSRLRQAFLRRGVLSGWSAWSRGDLDLMVVRYAPDYEFEPAFVGTGMRSVYRGHAGFREFAADLREAFEHFDLTPLEIVDAGDRVVFLGRIHTHARGSGVELDSPIGQVIWIERGLNVRDRGFLDWNEALRAAGIPVDLGLAPDADAPSA